MPENDDDKSLTESLGPAHKGASHAIRGKWSDVNDAAYELTLRECLLLTLLLLTCGVVAFSYVFEHWSVLDSLYFTTVILTTVGYGDITPTTRWGKLFASVFALGGIVILGLALGVVGSRLVEAEIEATEKMKEKSSRALEKAMRVSHRHPPPLNAMQFGSSVSLDSLDSVESIDAVSNKPSFEEEGAWSKLCSGCRRAFRLVQHHFPGFGPLLIGALIIAKLEDWDWVDAVYYCVVTSTVSMIVEM
jgi:voltage-gated potassium channel